MKFTEVGFPSQGWNIEWLENSNKKIVYHFNSCFYHKTLTAYGVPELTPLYCNVDSITFSGLPNSIRFERSKTIAQGDKVCDFQFIKKTGL